MDELLQRIAEATQERSKAQSDLDLKDQQWRALICAAIAGHRVADVAEAAGISRERVYQIRDGRR